MQVKILTVSTLPLPKIVDSETLLQGSEYSETVSDLIIGYYLGCRENTMKGFVLDSVSDRLPSSTALLGSSLITNF